RPRVLVDVSVVETGTTMLGVPVSLPLAIAPMATQSLAHPDAESAMARAAAGAGIPMILSTTSSQSIETAAGFGAIVLTVDLPVLGYRVRDRRSRFDLPPLGNFAEEAPTHGSHGGDWLVPLTEHLKTTLTWDDVARIRSWSSLPLVLKGILTVEDAQLAV